VTIANGYEPGLVCGDGAVVQHNGEFGVCCFPWSSCEFNERLSIGASIDDRFPHNTIHDHNKRWQGCPEQPIFPDIRDGEPRGRGRVDVGYRCDTIPRSRDPFQGNDGSYKRDLHEYHDGHPPPLGFVVSPFRWILRCACGGGRRLRFVISSLFSILQRQNFILFFFLA